MGNNNSMVGVMFEEIKGLLASIVKKLDERADAKESTTNPKTTTEQKTEVKTSSVNQEQLFRLIVVHLQEMDRKIGQASESARHSLSQIEELKRITISQKPDSKVRHYHVVDWKSNKVVITIVCLSVLLLTSLFGNFQQFIVNFRITDNDLKYRYIKSTNGISSNNLNELENIFHYHRDKKVIREIRKKVQEFEQNLKESSLRIERNQKSGQDQNSKPNLR